MPTGKYDPERAEEINQQQSWEDIENSSVLQEDLEKDNSKQLNTTQVDQAREESIQPRARDDADFQNPGSGGTLDAFIGTQIAALYQTTDTIPPWWSPQRDLALSALWKASNLLSGAMYMMTSKISTIPWHIEPEDRSIDRHVKTAKIFERRIYETANYGQGWGSFITQQVQSLLGTDNGRFMEIIDMSPDKTGPIIGPAFSVAHLDPHRCTRVSNPENPIIYLDVDGGKHQLHYTRVAFESQLPSEHATMYNVGFSAVSRATHYAQHMLDVARYKEEKLGSRPLRGVFLAGGGLDPEAVGQAFAIAKGMGDDMNLQRLSALPIIGNPEFDAPSLELITVSDLPDGFVEEDATMIAMAAISLAFGVDARELWPNMATSASRADTLTQHIKQRGKGPGHIIQETERIFNNWVLPDYLKFVFDFQDDAQDRQRAEINATRSKARSTDLEIGVSDVRTEREQMVTDGKLTQAQFNALELKDGRRPNGTPLETIFFDDNPLLTEILTLPSISDPLDIRGNDAELVLDAISKQVPVALERIETEKRERARQLAEQALAALQFLSEAYVSQQLPTGLAESSMQVFDPARENEEPPREEIPESEDDEQNAAKLESDPRELSEKEVVKEQPTAIDMFGGVVVKSNPYKNVIPSKKIKVQKKTKVSVPKITPEPKTQLHFELPEFVISPIVEEKKIEKEEPEEEFKEEQQFKEEVIDFKRNEMGEITTLIRRKEKDGKEHEVVELERNKMGEIIALKRRTKLDGVEK